MNRNSPRLRLVSEPVHDGALLARVAQGDVRALAKIYDQYATMMLRFARRLGAADEAEDVVQSVFLRVVRLSTGFDPSVASARPWLFAITMRVVQERRRSLRRLAAAMSALTAQKRSRSTASAPDSSDLERGLAKLSHAKRSVVLLAEVEGFSCDEIASMLQIPVGTVWTRLHHARRELRVALGEPS
ncbi:MAG: polymerase sigma-54 factor RpoN [Myxococcaceae bacterium]|nr:polymerase sigma-54 factor RpoN [Myxococcaceae bacterium]